MSDNTKLHTAYPLEGLSADDVRKWLLTNDTEQGLAIALAQAHNKTGMLMHDLDELIEPELSKVRVDFTDWHNLDKELYDRVITVMQNENASGKAKHSLDVKGLYFVVMPFMERNGFRDGAGWWITKKTS